MSVWLQVVCLFVLSASVSFVVSIGVAFLLWWRKHRASRTPSACHVGSSPVRKLQSLRAIVGEHWPDATPGEVDDIVMSIDFESYKRTGKSITGCEWIKGGLGHAIPTVTIGGEDE
jgi:hypothetical protein